MNLEKPTIQQLYFLQREFGNFIREKGEENCYQRTIELEGRYIPSIMYGIERAIKHYGDK